MYQSYLVPISASCLTTRESALPSSDSGWIDVPEEVDLDGGSGFSIPAFILGILLVVAGLLDMLRSSTV